MCLYKQFESFAKSHLTSFDQFNQTILSVYIQLIYVSESFAESVGFEPV